MRIQVAAAILAVGLVFVLGDDTPTSTSTKPGECERVEWERINCPVMPADAQPNCTSDAQCPGDQKCCDFPCAPQRCRDPAHVGTCPDFSNTKPKCPEEPASDSCQWDGDCEKDEKCCRGPCDTKSCWKSVPAPEKEGLCWDISNIMAKCIAGAYENSSTECYTDNDCSGNKKCCPQLCVKPQCKAPLKAGTCPMTIQGCASGSMPGPRNCIDDYNCTGDLKCCTDGCGGSNCVSPQYEEHAGECPVPPVLPCPIGFNKTDECSQDGQCPRDKKCCKSSCDGLRCTTPTGGPDPPPPVEHPGQCPATPVPSGTGSSGSNPGSSGVGNSKGSTGAGGTGAGGSPGAGDCARLCKDDSGCQRGLKCCSNGCGTECRSLGAADNCPPVLPPVCPNTCQDDSGCPPTSKCCTNDCGGKQCYDLTGGPDPPQLPPVCPYYASNRQCLIANNRSCAVGEKCSNGETCCEYECGGTRCEPDLCPAVDPNIFCAAIVRNNLYCNASDDCGADSICCAVPCGGRSCIKRATTHAGMCPNTEGTIGSCAITCESDTKCAANEKCCKTGCGGTSCMKAEKAGVCVRMMIACLNTTGRPADTCTTDYDCKGFDKCCEQPCGNKLCVPATIIDPPPPETKQVVHAGTCPNNTGIIASCLAACSSDDSCATDEKCCPYGCGTKCRKADTDVVSIKPEPKPVQNDFVCPYYDAKRVCVKANPQECTLGSLCEDGSPCCEYECGGTRCGRDLCPAVDPTVDCSLVLMRPPQCNASEQCGADSVCCSTICGSRFCMKKAHPGVCPAASGSVGLCAITCTGDYKCANDEKCCKTGCGGTSCVKALPEVHAGTCPANDPNVITTCMAYCDGDGSCAADEKCCPYGCSSRCLKADTSATTPKPAPLVCPVYDKNAVCDDKRYPYMCDPKQACSDGSTCCEYECSGTRCLQNLCPAPNLQIQCFAPEPKLCNSSSQCGGNKMCCETYCGGTKCLAPGEHYDKPGPPSGGTGGGDGSGNGGEKSVQGSDALVCPTAPTTCSGALRGRSCTSDSACGSKKCCSSGCSGINVCLTPVRQGTCPVSPDPRVRCMEPTKDDRKDKCGTDMACPGRQKCCGNPCPGFGKVCTDPVS